MGPNIQDPMVCKGDQTSRGPPRSQRLPPQQPVLNFTTWSLTFPLPLSELKFFNLPGIQLVLAASRWILLEYFCKLYKFYRPCFPHLFIIL